MKKILFILVLVLLLFSVGCKEEPNNPSGENGGSGTTEVKKLVVNYYDGETLIVSKEYQDETISLHDYNKDGFIFYGWYLDINLTTPYNRDNIKTYFEQESLNLYAKTESIMKDMNIEIKGFINQTEVVVNPLFVDRKSVV